MRHSEYTDYSLRVLMYCAGQKDRLITIAELADHYRLSKNHLMKIVNDLAHQGLLETLRGRGGGLRLLKKPEDIRIGDVVRQAENDFRLVECFDGRTNTCLLTPGCRLKGVFGAALRAYMKELDAVTLADIAEPDEALDTATRTLPRRAQAEAVAMAGPVPGRRSPTKAK